MCSQNNYFCNMCVLASLCEVKRISNTCGILFIHMHFTHIDTPPISGSFFYFIYVI